MPIIVTSPIPADPVGIGLQWEATLDIALFQAGDNLAVTIQDGPETQRVIGFSQVLDLHAPGPVLGTHGQTSGIPIPVWQTYPQWPHAVDGDQVRVVWAHRRSDNTVVDQLVTQHPYNTISGLQVALPRILPAATGSYTPADRELATSTNQAVHASMGVGGSIPIGELFDEVPINLLKLEVIGDFTGSGTLPGETSSDPTLRPVGLGWRVIQKAPGLGLNFDDPNNYDLSLLRLSIRNSMGDGAFKWVDVIDSHEDDMLWLPNQTLFTEMSYAIVPGVTMRFWWLKWIIPILPRVQLRTRRRRAAQDVESQ